MIAQELKALIERVETWPEAAQQELVRVARDIEAEIGETYVATAQELEGIDRGLAAAAQHRFAKAEEVEAVFARHRSR
jgi:hypothetical protein